MSSRDRRRHIRNTDNLLVSNPNAVDPKTVDAIGFGLGSLSEEIAAADSEFQAIEAVSIDKIYPNAIQPRNSVPHDITDVFPLIPENVVAIFERWIIEVQLETGQKDFDIKSYLQGAATERGEQAETFDERDIAEQAPLPKEHSLMKLIDLAASIRRDGLSNPITLAHRQRRYEIETGERRWLAYHILYWQFGDGDRRPDGSIANWSRIPSRAVKQVDVWRQASENNARDNLNAISRARQLSILLMDLHGWENFSGRDAFAGEQEFYAQVADGGAWRVPRGKGEQLLNAMGLSNAGQLRQYRALLRLPGNLWRKGDDENLTEGELRKMKAALDTVTGVTVAGGKRQQQDAIARLTAAAADLQRKLRKEIDAGDSSARPKLRKLIRTQINQLISLEDEIEDASS